MSWGGTENKDSAEKKAPLGIDHYRGLFSQKRRSNPIRMSLTGKENTAKTGLAISLARQRSDKRIIVLDIDNSASQTVAYNFAKDDNIEVIPLFDETDESIFNDDNTTNWTALIDKMGYFIKIIGEQLKENDDIGAVIVDGGSTFLKWCEQAMTHVLMTRSKNPVNVEDGDRFNQAEWRIRNQLFRDVMNRAHQLPVDAVFFTFHLKDVKQFADLGNGQKGLMKVGEQPDWERGTMRLFSQQIFLSRYTKKGDIAAGVKSDSKLAEGVWEIRASIEEMKGFNQEYLGQQHTVLRVENGDDEWMGLPFLTWEVKD